MFFFSFFKGCITDQSLKDSAVTRSGESNNRKLWDPVCLDVGSYEGLKVRIFQPLLLRFCQSVSRESSTLMKVQHLVFSVKVGTS